ncbi:EAL domain-containing protein [Vibrio vulnificus]
METAGGSERLAVSGVQNLLNNQIRTAIDDFGCHYSTKERVRLLHPAFVKVDKSIIQAGARQMQSAIACAHSVNALTIAEGIEDQQTLNQCIEVGFDYFQGYYLARPTKPM